ncbi:hypothetical protein Tco_0919177, partial [Tanacetum coccineum]
MDDPNITMEEYIKLEEEKARRRGKVYNRETATYGKIWDNEDVHDLRSVENEFPAIVFNDALTSKVTHSCEPTENDNEKVIMPSLPSPEPTVSCFDDLDFFKDFENEFTAIVYNDAQTSKSDLLIEPILSPQHIDKFDLNDETSVSEYDEEEQNVLYFNDLFPFNIIHPDDLKSEKDNDGNEIDIIQSSGDMALPPRLSARMLMEHRDAQGVSLFTSRSWRRLFDIRGPLFQLGGAKRNLSWRQFIVALGLYTVEEMESTASSSTVITDLILRLCHRLIACSIAGRSQAPEKVTVTDLFYLRGMDVGSVKVPYLLARYLRLFDDGRKSRALISGGQFVARLAEHFGLLSQELTIIAPALLGSERQPDATAGAHEAAEDAPAVDNDMPQAVPPLPRTRGERIARLEEEVHGMCELLQGQSEVLDHM